MGEDHPRDGRRVDDHRRVSAFGDLAHVRAGKQPGDLHHPLVRAYPVVGAPQHEGIRAHFGQSQFDPMVEHHAQFAEEPARPGLDVLQGAEPDHAGVLVDEVLEHPPRLPPRGSLGGVHGRRDQDDAVAERRMPRDGLRDDLRTHRMPDEQGIVDAEMLHERDDQVAGVCHRARYRRLGGFAEPGQIEGEHAPDDGEFSRESTEDGVAHADAVHEDEIRTAERAGRLVEDLLVSEANRAIARLGHVFTIRRGVVPRHLASLAAVAVSSSWPSRSQTAPPYPWRPPCLWRPRERVLPPAVPDDPSRRDGWPTR